MCKLEVIDSSGQSGIVHPPSFAVFFGWIHAMRMPPNSQRHPIFTNSIKCLQKRKLKILLVNNKILWGRCTRLTTTGVEEQQQQ